MTFNASGCLPVPASLGGLGPLCRCNDLARLKRAGADVVTATG